jgi:hypothetical protein
MPMNTREPMFKIEQVTRSGRHESLNRHKR